MSNTGQSEAPQAYSGTNLPRTPEKFTHEARLKALVNYAEFGQKIRAADAAGINPRTINRRIAEDSEFRDQWALAEEAFVECLRTELRDRAFRGQLTEKFDRAGNLISSTWVKSDALLLALLRAHAPKLFGDKKQIETKTSVTHEHILTLDTSKLSPGQREAMRRLLGPGEGETPSPEEPSDE